MAAGSDGQPETLPLRCVLPDGADMLIRAVQCEDATRLERLFYWLSQESISRLFFPPLPLQPQWAARLAEATGADGVERGALVAMVDEEIVGVACYDHTAPEEAEFGLLIEEGATHRHADWSDLKRRE
jgi:RimJ/RimL family protein N-acetyltransferase